MTAVECAGEEGSFRWQETEDRDTQLADGGARSPLSVVA